MPWAQRVLTVQRPRDLTPSLWEVLLAHPASLRPPSLGGVCAGLFLKAAPFYSLRGQCSTRQVPRRPCNPPGSALGAVDPVSPVCELWLPAPHSQHSSSPERGVQEGGSQVCSGLGWLPHPLMRAPSQAVCARGCEWSTQLTGPGCGGWHRGQACSLNVTDVHAWWLLHTGRLGLP